MPGVYVDLEELIALEQRGRRVSFLPTATVTACFPAASPRACAGAD